MPETTPSPESDNPLDQLAEVHMDGAFFELIRDEVLHGRAVFDDEGMVQRDNQGEIKRNSSGMNFITKAYLENSHNLTDEEAAAVLKTLQAEGYVAKDQTGDRGYGVFREGVDSRELSPAQKLRLSKLGKGVIAPLVQGKEYAYHNAVSRPNRYIAQPVTKVARVLSGTKARQERKAKKQSQQRVDQRWRESQSAELRLSGTDQPSDEARQRALAERQRRQEQRQQDYDRQRQERRRSRSPSSMPEGMQEARTKLMIVGAQIGSEIAEYLQDHGDSTPEDILIVEKQKIREKIIRQHYGADISEGDVAAIQRAMTKTT
jgi:hypothetical protein